MIDLECGLVDRFQTMNIEPPPPPPPKNVRLRACVKKVMQLLSKPGCKPMRDKAWIEFFDPKHRRPHELKELFSLWKETLQSKMSFWEFLVEQEEQNSKLLDPSIQIRYLTAQERAAYRIQLQPNEKGQATVALPDGNYMFVLGPDNQLYAGVEVRGQFHHSSFFAGKAVLTAGEFTVAGGIIEKGSSRSGHYRPEQREVDNFLKYVEGQGIDLKSFDFTIYEKIVG